MCVASEWYLGGCNEGESTHHSTQHCISSFFIYCVCLKILKAIFILLSAHYLWCILCVDTCLLFVKQARKPESAGCLSSVCKKWSAPFVFFCVCIWEECTDDGWRNDKCGCISQRFHTIWRLSLPEKCVQVH